jgi:hypothetical protein
VGCYLRRGWPILWYFDWAFSSRVAVRVAASDFSEPFMAYWYDPTSGKSATITGSPFPNQGSARFTPLDHNSGGDGDWVLSLTTMPQGKTPGSTTPYCEIDQLVVAAQFAPIILHLRVHKISEFADRVSARLSKKSVEFVPGPVLSKGSGL